MTLNRRVARVGQAGRYIHCMSVLERLLDLPDVEPLEDLMERVSDDVLEEMPMVIYAAIAYRRLGDKDSLELFHEELAEELSAEWMSAWEHHDAYSYQGAVACYWLLGKRGQEGLPVWMKEIPKSMGKVVDKVRCELLLHITAGEWGKCETVLKQHPEILEEAESRVIQRCIDLGLERPDAEAAARKSLQSGDRVDSYTLYLREMLRESDKG